MPRINPDEINSVSDVEQRLTFRERLMKRFSAHEFVRVKNIDKEVFKWQYLPSHQETFEFTPDPMKITQRGSVEAYSLSPGESEVIVGENAYVMIEALYKKIVARKVISKSPSTPPGFARNFNWTDGFMQEDIINKIYLGKESPTFGDTGKVEDVPVPKIKYKAGAHQRPTARIRKATDA